MAQMIGIRRRSSSVNAPYNDSNSADNGGEQRGNGIPLKIPEHYNDDPHWSGGADNRGYVPDSDPSGIFTTTSFSNPASDGSIPPVGSSAKMLDMEDDVEPEEELNRFMAGVETIQEQVGLFYQKHWPLMKKVLYVILVLLYAAYFGYAMYYTRLVDEDAIRLLWVTCLVVFVVLMQIAWRYLGPKLEGCTRVLGMHSERISWVVVILIYGGGIIFVIVDVAIISGKPSNLISGVGIITYIVLFFIFSYSPSKVKWRPVVWGLAIQFVLALIILRWTFGYQAFRWLGDRVAEFLAHTDAGSGFVFDEVYYERHYFAFKVLPVVIFFSAVVSVLYYLGVMQVAIRVIASCMQSLMGTTAGESLNAAGNIFVSQGEAPLLIKPMIKDMTRSELHAVMTGGYATIAGSVMAGYIMMGVKPNHLISASVMSAPAALAMSKLFWPETERTRTSADDVKDMAPSPERNVIEAASAGASTAIGLVANIAANLIAFIAMLEFLNQTLSWFGDRVGVEGLTFEFCLSYLLWPFAYIMGVVQDDCRVVAELIGVKTILNEFVAYGRLGELIENADIFGDWTNANGTAEVLSNRTIILQDNVTLNIASASEAFQKFYMREFDVQKIPDDNVNTTMAGPYWLPEGMISERSEVIATYALCGFANIGSLGIMLGGLGALAPERKPDIAATVVRAMIAGNVACFMTACIAGLLYQGELG